MHLQAKRTGWPTLVGIGLVVAAFMALSLVVTATGTARFAVAMGYDARVGYAVGGIFELAKGILLVGAIALWRRGARGTATVFGIGWICLVAFSCLATHATVSTAISGIERTGTWRMETRGNAKAELASVEQQLAALSRPTPPRPAKTVREALAGERVPSGVWRDSQECGSIQESIHFAKACAQVVQLRRELAAAQDFEHLSSRAAQLRNNLADAPILAPSDALPASFDATLGRLLPLGGTEGVALLLTLVVEIMSCFGLSGISLLYRARRDERARTPGTDSMVGQQTEVRSAALPAIGKGTETALDPTQGRLPDVAQVIQFPSAQERLGARIPTAPSGLPDPAQAHAGQDLGQTRRSAHLPGRVPPGEPAPRAAHGPAQGRANHLAAATAVSVFVSLLERGAGCRATGSELFHAYATQRLARGWPELKPNIFGMHLKAAVEKVGGRKFKSGGQIYEGVRLPPEWRGALVRTA